MPTEQLAAKALDTSTDPASDAAVFVKGGLIRRVLFNALPFKLPTTNSVLRTLFAKGGDYPTVLDYGMDPTGVSPCDTAFANMLADGLRAFVFPIGTFRFNNTIEVTESISILGVSPLHTLLRSYASGAKHGMRVIGNSGLGRSNLIEMRNFDFQRAGAAQTVAGSGPGLGNWSGIYLQRKVIMDNVRTGNWTNDGIYFAPSDADEGTSAGGTISNAVFFAQLENVWSKDNGRDGLAVRRGANANSFVRMQCDKNGRYGVHHYTDGFGTYGNTFRDGQASYNKQEGYRFANGTNLITSGLYAEHNGTPTNTDTDSYTNTAYDFYLGDNCTKSHFGLGVLLNGDTGKVRLPGFNPATIQVWEGGKRLFGDT